MRWVCRQVHRQPAPDSYTFINAPAVGPSFGWWVLHKLSHRTPTGEQRGQRMLSFCLRHGFLDVVSPKGELFWRWDFWNSWVRASLRCEALRRGPVGWDQ